LGHLQLQPGGISCHDLSLVGLPALLSLAFSVALNLRTPRIGVFLG
jgi:hypothetical protein